MEESQGYLNYLPDRLVTKEKLLTFNIYPGRNCILILLARVHISRPTISLEAGVESKRQIGIDSFKLPGLNQGKF